MNKLWNEFTVKLNTIRPFLRTKVGSRLGILAIIDFVVLFFAPLIHGFFGAALFGCVASVYLILIWRRFDKGHVAVPAVILCLPMLLDMLIYHHLDVTVAFVIAIIAILLAAFSPLLGFYDKIADLINAMLVAGAICVGVIAAAGVTLLLVRIAWWILCIIAFIAVVAIFMGVVFSTAAYTASDGRRQARRMRERRAEREEEDNAAEDPDKDPAELRYREYQPRRRGRVYDLGDDDVKDIEPRIRHKK